MPPDAKPFFIWGGTGQSKVVRPILERQGHRLVAVFDNDVLLPSPFKDTEIWGDRECFERRKLELPISSGFIVAVGGTHGKVRSDISSFLLQAGFIASSAVHHRAFIADTATVGSGCQIMAMAVVAEEATVGDYCILNTSASIDHECVLEEGCHVMPGATLAGSVHVEAFATIGSNATVLPRLRIGRGATIGAGSVVTKHVPAGATIVGVPGRQR